jgi:hypothetical protein
MNMKLPGCRSYLRSHKPSNWGVQVGAWTLNLRVLESVDQVILCWERTSGCILGILAASLTPLIHDSHRVFSQRLSRGQNQPWWLHRVEELLENRVGEESQHQNLRESLGQDMVFGLDLVDIRYSGIYRISIVI